MPLSWNHFIGVWMLIIGVIVFTTFIGKPLSWSIGSFLMMIIGFGIVAFTPGKEDKYVDKGR